MLDLDALCSKGVTIFEGQVFWGAFFSLLVLFGVAITIHSRTLEKALFGTGFGVGKISSHQGGELLTPISCVTETFYSLILNKGI